MKTLADNTTVSSRTYYYLLDFNDNDNWTYMQKHFNKTKLKDLTVKEYIQLFEHATTADKRSLNFEAI